MQSALCCIVHKGNPRSRIRRQSDHFWDLATGRSLGAIQDHGWRILGLCFSPDGNKFAVSNRIKVYVLEIGERAPNDWRSLDVMVGDALHISFSADGKHLITFSNVSHLQLWDVRTGGLCCTFDDQAHRTYTSISDPCVVDGKELLASGASDDSIYIWDVRCRLDHMERNTSSVDSTRQAQDENQDGIDIPSQRTLRRQ